MTRDGPAASKQASGRLQRLYVREKIVLRAHTIVRVRVSSNSDLYHHSPAYGALRPCKKSVKFCQITRCHMYDSSIHSNRREKIELRIVMSFS